MREVVVQGVVEVMNDREIAERSRSLHAALERMSELRSVQPVSNLPEFSAEPPRRRLFGFRDRARRALAAPSSD